MSCFVKLTLANVEIKFKLQNKILWNLKFFASIYQLKLIDMAIQLNFKCNESWENMQTTNTGRFCDSCAKNVFDLTNKTETEIEKLYRENNGKMCGRIRSTQLYISPRKKRKYLLAQFCLALFLVFGSMLFSVDAQSQTLHTKDRVYKGDIASDSLQVDYRNVTAKKESDNKEQEIMLSGEIAIVEEAKTITGVVTDKDTKEPLPFVNVFYKFNEKTYGTTTDFDGRYTLTLTKDIDIESLALEFNFVGYNRHKVEGISFKEGENSTVVNSEMYSEVILMGDVMFVEPTPNHSFNKDPEKQGETTFDSEDIRRSPYR